MVEQESWFLWKKRHRSRKNRNPEDSYRNYQPSLGKYMRKAPHHSDIVDSLNPCHWRGKRLHHHGGGVCWLFVLLWMDSWCHELIVCKKWYKNNLKVRLTGLLFDPPRVAPHHRFVTTMIITGYSLIKIIIIVGINIVELFFIWPQLPSWYLYGLVMALVVPHCELYLELQTCDQYHPYILNSFHLWHPTWTKCLLYLDWLLLLLLQLSCWRHDSFYSKNCRLHQ